MSLAVSLPVPGVPLAATADLVRRCADLGYTAVWASEVAGPDFASLLGSVAHTGVDLGVAVVPVQTRAPWLIAATAASLAHLSQGRFSLGLGTSSEVIAEQWSGIPFERPLTRLRETVAVVRAMLAGERVDHEGTFTTHGYRLPLPPPAPIPLLVGALNPASLRQAGAIGDGVCLNQLGERHVPLVLDEVRAGAAEAGRPAPTDRVVARLFCQVTDDVGAARTGLRRTFAPYVATSVYNRFYRWLGFEEEAQAVLDALAAGDRAAAGAALSDALLDTVTVVGDANVVAARVRAYLDAGVTVAAIQPLDADAEGAERTLRAAAAALT